MILFEREFEAIQTNKPVISKQPVVIAAPIGILQKFTTTTAPVIETVQWDSVTGADTVEVTSGSITFGAADQTKTINNLSLSQDGRHYIVSFLQPVQPVSITLHGFTYIPAGGAEPVSFSASSNSRLVVAIPNDQTNWLPVYSIPHISKVSTPIQYGGAALSGHTVVFPRDMQPVKKLRLSVINHFGKDNEDALIIDMDRVSAMIMNLPVDLSLKDDTANNVLFEHPGLLPSSMTNVVYDMANPALATFNDQLSAQQDLSFRYTLQAQSGTAFRYATNPIKGALLRTFKGVSSVTLEGEPQQLPLNLDAGNLDTEQPGSVTADLVVNYNYLRLLAHLNDDKPVTSGNVSGRIVDEAGVKRVLLDDEIADYPIDRIGLIGRAPETCELSLSLFAGPVENPDQPLTDPGVIQLEASTNIQVVWIGLPETVSHAGPLVLRVRANSGRFFWVTNPEPAVKVVVRDTNPGARPVRINNQLLTNLDEERIYLPQISIRPDLVTGELPILSSELFVTVEFTDLTLRYKR